MELESTKTVEAALQYISKERSLQQGRVIRAQASFEITALLVCCALVAVQLIQGSAEQCGIGAVASESGHSHNMPQIEETRLTCPGSADRAGTHKQGWLTTTKSATAEEE